MMTKIYLCPSDRKYGCSWEGSSDDILDHFIQEHEDILLYTNSVSINLDVPSENFLLFVDTEIYLLQAKILEGYLCIFLRYLGPVKIAAKITFDIEILSNEEKLDKHDIEMKDGCFSISLECLRSQFHDINVVNCQILISGDFTSNSSDDGVFLEDESFVQKEQEDVSKSPQEELLETKNLTVKSILERNFSIESNGDSSPNLEDLFSSSNSPSEEPKVRPKSLEGSRSKWYETFNMLFGDPESPKSDQASLQRSNTFGCEDIKRRTPVKRRPSMRSLGSIRESDCELEMRCSNCNSHLAPPIFLCEADHNICANCYRDHEFCTICELKITADRNLELEEKSIEYIYNCKNRKNGCPQRLSYQEICDHEINCTFCFYVCPIEECGYKGPYRSMVSHLNLIHSSVKMLESFIAVFQKYTEVFLVHEKMGIFYCIMKALDSEVIWKAKFCGPKERKFFCELKFKGKNFKYPLLLVKFDDYYIKEIPNCDLKEHKVKPKHSILAITR